MSRGLTEREFTSLHGAYPTRALHADQWGERGFFYDPSDRRFGIYAIDRKEQTDEVETVDAAESLFERCSPEHHPELRSWLDSLRPQRSADET
jgi:hypothetical protein